MSKLFLLSRFVALERGCSFGKHTSDLRDSRDSCLEGFKGFRDSRGIHVQSSNNHDLRDSGIKGFISNHVLRGIQGFDGIEGFAKL